MTNELIIDHVTPASASQPSRVGLLVRSNFYTLTGIGGAGAVSAGAEYLAPGWGFPVLDVAFGVGLAGSFALAAYDATRCYRKLAAATKEMGTGLTNFGVTYGIAGWGAMCGFAQGSVATMGVVKFVLGNDDFSRPEHSFFYVGLAAFSALILPVSAFIVDMRARQSFIDNYGDPLPTLDETTISPRMRDVNPDIDLGLPRITNRRPALTDRRKIDKPFQL
jgi:hypothetical protein